MRLIDADKLMLLLNDYALQKSPSNVESADGRKISGVVCSAIQNCMKAVEEQPTVFDVAKEEVKKKAQELSSQAFFLSILNCNQIFPGLFSALSVYGQNSVSGFLVSLKRIDGVLICFSG